MNNNFSKMQLKIIKHVLNNYLKDQKSELKSQFDWEVRKIITKIKDQMIDSKMDKTDSLNNGK